MRFRREKEFLLSLGDISAYSLREDRIYISWKKEIALEDEAFKLLVNEIDHEYLHAIIFREIQNSFATIGFDKTLLQVDQAIGWESVRSFVNFLYRFGCKEKLKKARLLWKGNK